VKRTDALGAQSDATSPEVVCDLSALRRRLSAWRTAGRSIGLVPTMGALHAGHRALVEEAGRECARVVATIFVNPIQFNDKSDLQGYPRREAKDLALLAEAGADLVYMPDLANSPRGSRSAAVSAIAFAPLPVPAIWKAWPRWSPSCSYRFSPTSPISARRTINNC
jgi:hypothetical protein